MIERDFWDGWLRAEKRDENKKIKKKIRESEGFENIWREMQARRGEWKAKKLSENKDVRFLGCCGVKSSLELNILNIIFHLNFYFLIFQKTHIRYIKFHLKKKKKWCGIRCYASFVLMQNIFLFSIKFGWWEQDSGCSYWSY